MWIPPVLSSWATSRGAVVCESSMDLPPGLFWPCHEFQSVDCADVKMTTGIILWDVLMPLKLNCARWWHSASRIARDKGHHYYMYMHGKKRECMKYQCKIFCFQNSKGQRTSLLYIYAWKKEGVYEVLMQISDRLMRDLRVQMDVVVFLHLHKCVWQGTFLGDSLA